jgi:hypothetical protein
MPRIAEFPYDVFLSHSATDKAVVRPLAERLRQDGLKVWFDEWAPPVAATRQSAANSSTELMREEEDGGALPRRRYDEMIEAGLEHSRVLVLCMSANAFGSDWAQLEAGTCGRGNLPFRDPLNRERRFIPLRLDDAPIKGSLAQFLYINWLPAVLEQEYTKPPTTTLN